MKRPTKILALVLVFFIIMNALSACSALNESKGNTTELFALDTIISVTLYGENKQEKVQKITKEINRLERLFSVTIEDSDISRINKSSGSFVKVSEETFSLIKYSKQFAQITNGCFDITIYPLVKLWGFTTKEYNVPNKKEIEKTIQLVDYKKIELNHEENSVKIEDNMALDLGAVAKGYISQRISEILQDMGETSAIINLGGNVELLGGKTNGKPWNIGVKYPNETGHFAQIEVSDCAVITSGGYQRNFEKDGQIYHHIINPKTGFPADSKIISATVISEDSVMADAFSTALYVMGIDEAIEIYSKCNNLEFILLGEKDVVYITKGIEEKFSLAEEYSHLSLKIVG